MPSWWMPASCANALRPTIALFAWTASPVSSVRSWLARVDLARDDARRERQLVGPHAERHDDLLEGRVARALADTVHGALDLAAARFDRREAVRDGEAEVVVAVRREDDAVRAGGARANRREELVDLVRRRVADGVREVHGRRAGLDHRGHDRAEVVEVAPRRVLGRELHVVDVPPRAGDRAGRGLESLAARHVELVREVEVRRGDERVEARPGAAVERLERAVHVRVHGARERGDNGTADGLRDGADAREVVLRGDREPGLEDVHAELVELDGEAHLLRLAHREAGRLLAVPERRVEDRDARPNVALRVHGHATFPMTTGWRNGIFSRSSAPTVSRSCVRSFSRVASKFGRPARFSAIQFSA